MVLDKSDPGFRFNSPFNVQSSKARKYLGNKIAFNEILCSLAAPLPEEKKKCPYPWLLEGNEREVRRIDGLNGLAAKLLHTYAQITHMTRRVMVVSLPILSILVGQPCSNQVESPDDGGTNGWKDNGIKTSQLPAMVGLRRGIHHTGNDASGVQARC